jgi:predicted nuclease with TOPRIM domain
LSDLIPFVNEEIEELRKKIDELNAEMNITKDLLMNGQITYPVYIERTNQIYSERERLREKLVMMHMLRDRLKQLK